MARRKCTYDIPATLDGTLIYVLQIPSYLLVVTLTYLRGVLLLPVHLSPKYLSSPSLSLNLLVFKLEPWVLIAIG
jgi:hypothetical protein